MILVERDMDDDVIIIEDDPVQPEIDSAGDRPIIEEDEGALEWILFQHLLVEPAAMLQP